MRLRVPAEQFADEAKSRLPKEQAYLESVDMGVRASVADPHVPLCIEAEFPSSTVEQVASLLTKQGLDSRPGSWDKAASEPRANLKFWVGAVAYPSASSRPGLWIDIFPALPSDEDVLGAMLDEFARQGLMPETTPKDFLLAFKVNILVIGPEQQEGLLAQHENG